MKKAVLLIYIATFLITGPLTLKAQANKTGEKQNNLPGSLTCPPPPAGYGNFTVEVPPLLPVNGLTKQGYQLVFDDEFDSALSSQKWDFDGILDIYNDPVRFDAGNIWNNVPAPYNDNFINGVAYESYFIDPTSKDLKLRVTALNDSLFKYGPYTSPKYLSPNYTGNPMFSFGNTFNYSGAILISNSILYHGYFEMEAKFPTGKASYPSFWFNNREEHFNYPYPDTHREIDVIDDTYYPITSTYPFGCLFSSTFNFPAVVCAFKPGTDTLVDLSQNFHLYAVDWEADSVKFYIDNQLIRSLPDTVPYDGRMQMILANVISQSQINANPETGTVQGQNDFEIKYVRAWQKPDNMFNWYFINLCNTDYGGVQVWKNPKGFFSTPYNYPPYNYAIETDYIPGSSYSWKSSDSTKLILDPPPSTWTVDSFAENGSRCYFHGNTPGNYSIYLTATLPNDLGGIKESRTIPITILPDSLPTPIIHVSLDSSMCNYKVCVDTVPGASSYAWSRDGLHWSLPLPNMCPSNFAIPPDSSYTLLVQAFYIACNGQQLSSPIGAISGKTLPYKCDTAKKSIVFVQNLIKAYPSPSDGNLWIENDFSDDVTISLWLDTGALLRTFTVAAGEKIETNDLPEGMIILEAVRSNGHQIVGHKLLPVFRH